MKSSAFNAGRKRSRKIWQGIVDYANATDLASNKKALESVKWLSTLCLPPGVRVKRKWDEREAVYYQPIASRLLYWLCRPHEETCIPVQEVGDRPPIMVHPVDFLNGELCDAVGDLQRVVSGSPSLYFWRMSRFHSFLGPICKFIVDDLEGPNQRAPIRICEREGCGKFILPEREGRKRFCSDQCRASTFQGSRDDWNAYMRDYRRLKRERKARKQRKGKK